MWKCNVSKKKKKTILYNLLRNIKRQFRFVIKNRSKEKFLNKIKSSLQCTSLNVKCNVECRKFHVIYLKEEKKKKTKYYVI